MTEQHTHGAPQIFLDFAPNLGAQGGISQSLPDKLYRWATWRFWDVGRRYINFVCLCPGVGDGSARIEAWLERWERGPERAAWKIGGYVVTGLFGRVAGSAGELRRLSQGGVDVVGDRNAMALMTFAQKSCMIVMLPEIDDAMDVRPEHQAFVLSALPGLGIPVAVVDLQTMMPREIKT